MTSSDRVELAGEVCNKVFEFLCLFPHLRPEVARKRLRLSKRDFTRALEDLFLLNLIEMGYDRRLRFWKKPKVKLKDSRKRRRTVKVLREKKVSCDGFVFFYTKVDALFELLSRFDTLYVSDLCETLGVGEPELIRCAKILEMGGFVRFMDGKHPSIRLLGGAPSKTNVGPNAPFAEKPYSFESNGFCWQAGFKEVAGERLYFVEVPRFSKPLEYLISYVFEAAGDLGEGFDFRGDFLNAKQSLKADVVGCVSETLGFLSDDCLSAIVSRLINEMHLGDLEYLLADPLVEEVKAQSGYPVHIKHLGAGCEWVRTNLCLSKDVLLRYAQSIACETDQRVDSSSPLMDGVLHTGDRVNVCLPETSGGDVVLEVRVFSKDPWNFTKLVKNNTVSVEACALLWQAVQFKLNVLVSGETGCGKTSFVNCLCLLLSKNDHIVSVEDTREIRLGESFKNWSHLTSNAGVSMNDLLINSLRMDPSVIVMGEVRGAEDIRSLMRALSMGHPVVSTIHARDSRACVKRFVDAGVLAQDLEGVHLNVVMESVRVGGENVRRVKEIARYHPDGGGGVCCERLFSYDIGADTLVRVGAGPCLKDLVFEKTGWDVARVSEDLSGKMRVLSFMLEHGVSDLEGFSKVLDCYWRDPVGFVKALDEKEVSIDGLEEHMGSSCTV